MRRRSWVLGLIAAGLIAALAFFAGMRENTFAPGTAGSESRPTQALAADPGGDGNPGAEVSPLHETDIRLPSAFVEGLILDKGGQPVEGAHVTIRRAGPHGGAEARSTERGEFRIPWEGPRGLAAVRFTCDGFVPVLLRADAPTRGLLIRLKDSPTVKLSIRRDDQQLMDQRVDIRLLWRPSDLPLSDCPFAGELFGESVSREMLSIGEVPATLAARCFGPGELTIRATSADRRWTGIWAGAVAEDAREFPAEVVLSETEPRDARGVVLDAQTKEPIPGAHLQIVVRSNRGFSDYGGHPPVPSDDQGRFVIALTGGSRLLRCTAPGYSWSVCSARQKDPTASISILLNRGRAITGTVVDSNGDPLTGRRVAILEADRVHEVAPTGAFEAGGIPRSRSSTAQVLFDTGNLLSTEHYFPAGEDDAELRFERMRWVSFALEQDGQPYPRELELQLKPVAEGEQAAYTKYRCRCAPARIPLSAPGEYRAILVLPRSQRVSRQRFKLEGVTVTKETERLIASFPTSSLHISLETEVPGASEVVAFELFARDVQYRLSHSEGPSQVMVTPLSGETTGQISTGAPTLVPVVWPGTYGVRFLVGRGADTITVAEGTGINRLKYRLLQDGSVERVP